MGAFLAGAGTFLLIVSIADFRRAWRIRNDEWKARERVACTLTGFLFGVAGAVLAGSAFLA